MVTLESLILQRLNDAQNAVLMDNYPFALNALSLLWSMIPNEEIREKIEEKRQEYIEQWNKRLEELKYLFNEREYDEVTRRLRLKAEEENHIVEMVTGMLEYTTKLIIEYNIVAREPVVK